jgi:hypothetical protein
VTTVWALPSARGSGVSENVFEICLLRSGAWHAPSLRWNAAPLLPVRTRPSALRSHAPGPARPALRADEARPQTRSERFVRFRTAEILIPGGNRIRVRADQAPVPSRDAVAAHGRPPGNQVTRTGISLTSRPSRIQDVRYRFQHLAPPPRMAGAPATVPGGPTHRPARRADWRFRSTAEAQHQ